MTWLRSYEGTPDNVRRGMSVLMQRLAEDDAATMEEHPVRDIHQRQARDAITKAEEFLAAVPAGFDCVVTIVGHVVQHGPDNILHHNWFVIPEQYPAP